MHHFVAGVELAFCLRQRLARETGAEPALTLVERGPRILGGLPGALRRAGISKPCRLARGRSYG